MIVKSVWGILCLLLVLCLCGCKSEHQTVYPYSLEDTWQAVQIATMLTIDTASCSQDDKNHVIYTPCFACDSGLKDYGIKPSPEAEGTGKWNDPFMSQEDTVSSNKDSIRYGTTEAPGREHYRQAYWYAIIRCRAKGSGTQVLVAIQKPARNSQTPDDNRSQDTDACAACRGSQDCPNAVAWGSRFVAELNKQLERISNQASSANATPPANK